MQKLYFYSLAMRLFEIKTKKTIPFTTTKYY